MTSHDLAVPHESRGRQDFGEGISHLFVRAQRHEFEETIQYDFTHIVLADVNLTGELSVHQILAHRNTSEVVFVEKSGFSLRKSEIGQRFTSVDRCLPCLAGCNKFSFGSRKRHVVLSSILAFL